MIVEFAYLKNGVVFIGELSGKFYVRSYKMNSSVQNVNLYDHSNSNVMKSFLSSWRSYINICLSNDMLTCIPENNPGSWCLFL